MGFLGTIRSEWTKLRLSLRFMHRVCHTMVAVNNAILKSNASDELKAASAALVASTNDFCVALTAFYDSINV